MIESKPRPAWQEDSAWLSLSSLVIALVAIAFFLPLTAPAQTFQVINNFSEDAIGIEPMAGLTIDRAGNLYGTTSLNGSHGYGAVFKMVKRNGAWTNAPIFEFDGTNAGAFPEARVVFGPDGALYGTTSEGGSDQCLFRGCGVVFKLTPNPTACGSFLCLWRETVLYRFQGGVDGRTPGFGDLVFDHNGSIYGTTLGGGEYDYGAVFQLTNSGGSWTENVIYSFTGGTDGYDPEGGVVFDTNGNLFGTSEIGVYELSPSGNGWTFNQVHTFSFYMYGLGSESGVVLDAAGNVYGDTILGGPGQGGTVYEGSPSGQGWNLGVIYPFNGGAGSAGSAFLFDASGNLLATRLATQNNYGEVFKLTPYAGGWNYTQLHEFLDNYDDGSTPYGGVVIDADGNLYGTTYGGGYYNFGVVYEITP